MLPYMYLSLVLVPPMSSKVKKIRNYDYSKDFKDLNE